MHVAKQGGSPTHRSRELHQAVTEMLNKGKKPCEIREYIKTDKHCTGEEKRKLLKEMHMEE